MYMGIIHIDFYNLLLRISSLHVYGDYPDLKPVYDNNGDFTPCIWGLSWTNHCRSLHRQLHSMYMGIILKNGQLGTRESPSLHVYGDYPNRQHKQYYRKKLHSMYMGIIRGSDGRAAGEDASLHVYGDYPTRHFCKRRYPASTPYIRGLSVLFGW